MNFVIRIVIPFVFVFLAANFVYRQGCFNGFLYRTRFNDRRVEAGLHPFMDTWSHKRMDDAHQWFNPEEQKQGLYCWYKQQRFSYNSLDMETDAWKYTEGDSVNLLIFHTYFFNRQTTISTVPSNTNHSFLPADTSTFLKRHGQSLNDYAAFSKAMAFLKNREDSLRLNNR